MDLRRLRILAELSRLGSMHEVAEELCVTTSTVSQQLAVLAREAGARLTEPDGRRVRLTPAGRRLAEHAVTILAAGYGVGLLPADQPVRSGVRLLSLTEPGLTLRSYAVTRLGRTNWSPLALVVGLLGAG